MMRVLGMYPRRPMQHRVLTVKHALICYDRSNNPANVVIPGEMWKLGYGTIVVGAVVKGIMPFEFAVTSKLTSSSMRQLMIQSKCSMS